MSTISNSIAAIGRSVAGAMVLVSVVFTENGVTHSQTGSGFWNGPNDVTTALHVVHPEHTSYQSTIIVNSITVTTPNGISIPVESVQSFTDLAEWDAKVWAQGGESPHEVAVDIAVLKTTKAAGFQTGWFPMYDLDSGPVTVHGYPKGAGGYKFFSGALQDTSFRGDGYSFISHVVPVPGESGGLVMDAVGNAVGVVSGGVFGQEGMNAVDLSPELIAKVQNSIAINNAFIAAELKGHEYASFAYRLAPTWADFNLSALVAQLGGPNTAAASAQIQNTVNDAVAAVLPQFGAGNFVDAIFQTYIHANPSPADHDYWAAEMEARPAEVIGIVAQNVEYAFMGLIPLS